MIINNPNLHSLFSVNSIAPKRLSIMLRPSLLGAAAVALLLRATLGRADPFSRDRAAFVSRRTAALEVNMNPTTNPIAASPRSSSSSATSSSTSATAAMNILGSSMRGGASTIKDEDGESEDEEEEEDAIENALEQVVDSEAEETEQVVLDASLAAAALKSASKSHAKAVSEKVQTAKNTVNAQLSETKPNVKSGGNKAAAIPKKVPHRRLFKLPYIIRAILNPFTVVSMTKAYWASLVNLNYLQQQQPQKGQELRSALEEKAKRNTGGPPKGRRKMKRGQAKTLSDLPQLST